MYERFLQRSSKANRPARWAGNFWDTLYPHPTAEGVKNAFFYSPSKMSVGVSAFLRCPWSVRFFIWSKFRRILPQAVGGVKKLRLSFFRLLYSSRFSLRMRIFQKTMLYDCRFKRLDGQKVYRREKLYCACRKKVTEAGGNARLLWRADRTESAGAWSEHLLGRHDAR